MQLTSRKQHLSLQRVHTNIFIFFFLLFLSNNIKEEQAKMIHTQKEGENNA